MSLVLHFHWKANLGNSFLWHVNISRTQEEESQTAKREDEQERHRDNKKDLNKVKQSEPPNDDDNVDDSGAGCCYCYLRELTFVNWVILTEWEQSIQRGPLVVYALFHYKTLPLSTDSF